MKEKLLYAAWLGMYILCVGLSAITQRNTVVQIAMTALAVMFFLPGGLLVWDGLRSNNRPQLLRVRIVSLCSLALTLLMIVLNIVFVTAGDAVGAALHDLLLLVSAPMFCCYWQIIGPFLWACLLISSFPRMWKK